MSLLKTQYYSLCFTRLCFCLCLHGSEASIVFWGLAFLAASIQLRADFCSAQCIMDNTGSLNPLLCLTDNVVKVIPARCPSHNAFKCTGECGFDECNTHFMEQDALQEHINRGREKKMCLSSSCSQVYSLLCYYSYAILLKQLFYM